MIKKNLVPCLEVYGDDLKLAKYFADDEGDINGGSTSSTNWFCYPPDSDIIVQNDPWVSSVGISTGFQIMACSNNL